MKRVIVAVSLVFTALVPLSAAAVRDKAPAFELKDLKGHPVSYKGTEGKVAFINFWATWCAPCTNEFPKLNELAADYKGKVRVYAISLDDSNVPAKIEKWLNKRAPGTLSITVLSDPENKSASDYDVNAMPTSFIVDRQGVVQFVHRGFDPDDPAVWKKEIDSLLR
jgi:thiol-disulfide isomerase/thioredoxin